MHYTPLQKSTTIGYHSPNLCYFFPLWTNLLVLPRASCKWLPHFLPHMLTFCSTSFSFYLWLCCSGVGMGRGASSWGPLFFCGAPLFLPPPPPPPKKKRSLRAGSLELTLWSPAIRDNVLLATVFYCSCYISCFQVIP